MNQSKTTTTTKNNSIAFYLEHTKDYQPYNPRHSTLRSQYSGAREEKSNGQHAAMDTANQLSFAQCTIQLMDLSYSVLKL